MKGCCAASFVLDHSELMRLFFFCHFLWFGKTIQNDSHWENSTLYKTSGICKPNNQKCHNEVIQIDFNTNRVYLPKIGAVKTVFHRRFSGTPKTCTVVTTLTGKFFISIVVDDGKKPPLKSPVTNKQSVGFDVGLTTYINLSTGEKVGNPRHLQNSLKRLRCLHRRLSR